jgi:hypothetical protein
MKHTVNISNFLDDELFHYSVARSVGKGSDKVIEAVVSVDRETFLSKIFYRVLDHKKEVDITPMLSYAISTYNELD